MTGTEDRAMLDELGALLARIDPVPAAVHAAAEAAGALLTDQLDWEWLDLVEPLAAVRGRSRWLTFGAGGAVVVELEVRADRVTGLLSPGHGVSDVELRGTGTPQVVRPDETGCFQVLRPAAGGVRLVLWRPGAATLATHWFQP